MPRKTVLIVYHSRTGGSAQLAVAAARGAANEDVSVRLLSAAHAEANDVLTADGYIFATPENLAAMAGEMKAFFDRTYYAVLERVVARPYVSLICAGSDGSNAGRQIERICTGWRLKAIAAPLIVCTHAQTPAAILAAKHISSVDLQRCEELGATLAAGLALGVF